MSEWQALAAGFAFYLILEGLLPFFNPGGFRRYLIQVLEMNEKQLRSMGAVMMVLGLALLFAVK